MLDKLKTDIDEILQLVKKVPSELQDTALKTLLEQWFRTHAAPQAPGPTGAPATLSPPASELNAIPDAFRPFMVANSLTPKALEKVFHPVGPGAQVLVSEIPGKGKAGKQISLVLLLSVKQALGGGTFGCGLEELRQMCLHYDCYDSANFAATLKNNATLFKTRKKGDDIELSASGMKKAAELVKGYSAGS